jgi:hypothetical protein
MPTKRTDITDELIASLDEAADIMAGRRQPARLWHPPASVDVRAIRNGWDSVKVIARSPEVVDAALASSTPRAA